MKILFVCENYYPHYGGAEVLFKNLAEGYIRKGNIVSVITQQLQKTEKKEVINGVHLQRVYSFHSRYLFSFLALPRVLREARNYDLIQTTTFNGAFPAWIAAKIMGKKVAITVHEVWVGKWKEITGFPWWKSTLHNLLEQMIYVLPFDKYICVSEATRCDLLRLSIAREKVEMVYNGFDYSSWDKKKYAPEKIMAVRNNLGQEKFIYFSWGRPGASKGFEYFIQAVPQILEKKPTATFVLLLGSIEKYQQKYKQLKQLIATLKLEQNVKIIDSIPYAELGYYILAADCVVVPSIAEGFGYTAVEASALGKPVVVSNAGSLPEIVSGKHLIFQSKNSADLAEKALLCAEGKYTETPLKRFEWEKTINGYLQVYDSLLANKRGIS